VRESERGVFETPLSLSKPLARTLTPHTLKPLVSYLLPSP